MAVFNKSQSCPMRWEEAIKDVSLFRDFVCFLTEHLQEKKLRKNTCHYTVNIMHRV